RRAVARLSHPHIVSTFDLAATCLVMAYVDGADLGQRVARGAIVPRDAVVWTLQIASALAHAHARGIVHRDVKPSNILIDGRGNALLADFGAAHFLDDAGHDRARIGTPAYMAPEQESGAPITAAADQYALARTLLEMLCGHRPSANDGNPIARLPASTPAP